jgi:hypothetical protein
MWNDWNVPMNLRSLPAEGDQDTPFRSSARYVGSRRKLPVSLREAACRQCASILTVEQAPARSRKLPFILLTANGGRSDGTLEKILPLALIDATAVPTILVAADSEQWVRMVIFTDLCAGSYALPFRKSAAHLL